MVPAVTRPEDFEGWEPYRPPWYPADLPNPNTIVSSMSDNRVTNYTRWTASLEPGELLRRIAEHREATS